MKIEQSGFVPKPTIGLMILGRKRPGFDPAWGAEVTRSIHAYLDELPWSVHVPEPSITDDGELRAAVESCTQAGVTVLLLVQPTISDGRLAPLLSRIWNKPLVLWATGEKKTGSAISANSLVGTHVMAATLRQMGHSLEFVYGDPRERETQGRVRQSILAAHAADAVTGRLFGLVGYHAPGFVDFHADPVFISDSLDSQLYHMSTPELVSLVESFSDDEIAPDLAALRKLEIPWGETLPEGGISPDGAVELAMQARYYRAFRTLFEREGFEALAFRCWPDLPNLTGHWPYLALAFLVSQGYPIAMEGDVDGAICSRIAESLGIGPVYLTDWLEHTRDTATIWHTGAAPFQLCIPPGSPGGMRLGGQFNNRRPTVVEGTIRPGMPATLFRLWRYDGTYHMTALEGETIQPERELMATNGLFATDRVDVYEWFEEMVQVGMPHHLCIVEGHQGETLHRVARLIGAESV